MSERTRRAFLALGAGVVGTLAGCAGDGNPATETGTPTPDSNDGSTPTATPPPASGIASLSFNHAEKLHNLGADFPERDVASYYLAVLTSEDHAAAFPAGRFGNEEAKSVLAETDFTANALVVLQDRAGSSHPDLELLNAEVKNRLATVEAEYPGQGGTADITTDTLLVRLPRGDEPVRGARATIHPQHGEADRFATDSVYDTVPEFSPAGGLVVQNRDCDGVSLSVTVTYRGDLFFRRGLDLGPATRRRVPAVFTHPGEWTVAVEEGGQPRTETWTLSEAPPGDALVDVAGDGTVSLSHRPDGVADDPLDACETDGYPYESSTPAENVDPPVDLWILDMAGDASRLTVMIEEGDTTVFQQEFETRTGKDKIRRSGLLAKKAAYTVEVTTQDGRQTTETVTVREGVDQLTVRVTEGGDLAVSLS